MKSYQALQSLSDKALFDYVTDSTECVYCDWREAPEDIVTLCNQFITEDLQLAYAEVDDGFSISNVKNSRFLSFDEDEELDEGVEGYIDMIRELVSPTYLIKQFTITEGTDCCSFYLQPKTYWDEFPKVIQDKLFYSE